jgi:hypothetical protein
VENIIKELKADYPLAKIPSGQFAANEAYLPPAYHTMTLGTLRRQLLMTPGALAQKAQGPVLRIPSAPSRQEAIKHARKRIARIKL